LVFGVWCLLFSGCWLRFSGFKLFGVCYFWLLVFWLICCGLRVEIGFCLVLLYQFADHEQRA
jgi:hypothetical protein